MDLATLGMLTLLAASAGLNLYLYKRPRRATPSVEAAEMLRQILSGGAIIQIKCLDPDSLMLRSPRSWGGGR